MRAPAATPTWARILHQVADRTRQRGLIILISDLIDDEAAIASGLQHFRHRHHEVIVFHVLDDAELTFPYDRLTQFKDMEGSGTVVTNPKNLRSQYLARMQTFVERIRDACFSRKISYNLSNTQQPYDVLLAAYLDKRSRLG